MQLKGIYLIPALNITCGVLVLLLLLAEQQEWNLGVWLFKTSASLSFVALAWAHEALLKGPYGLGILVAVIFCLIGDILLITHSRKFFLLGVVAFLLGHLAFLAAFFTGLSSFNLWWLVIALIIEGLFIFFIMRWPWPEIPKELFIPVNLYIVVISLMVAVAASGVGGGGHWIILLAAVMFFLSDISVARHQFRSRQFMNKLWGLPLYYGAVLLFVSTLSFM
ncbi:MAG: lysoplasmalogenase [Bdellovibrionota bacterium]|mgnify:CR=1 FL=1